MLVEAVVGRVGADHQQIGAAGEAPIARASQQDRNHAHLQLDGLAPGTTELDLGAAARDAQHFVRAGVEMQEDGGVPLRQPSPQPCAANAASKAAAGSGVALTSSAPGIEHQRQARVVRRLAVILETERLRSQVLLMGVMRASAHLTREGDTGSARNSCYIDLASRSRSATLRSTIFRNCTSSGPRSRPCLVAGLAMGLVGRPADQQLEMQMRAGGAAGAAGEADHVALLDPHAGRDAGREGRERWP